MSGTDDLQVIGIGASAGGLAALETFFTSCPSNSGAAFVVIQHLSPKHESLMADLLGRRTSMPVTMIETDTRIKADHVYLIPPGAVMRLDDGMLRLFPRSEVLSLPIDIFFSSLAESYGRKSTGIILSGTGSDGTRGAIAINEAGGLVLTQDPSEAKFDGMPMSVQRAGVVDESLPAAELAARALQHHAKAPPIAVPETSESADKESERPAARGIDAESAALELIFERLLDASGIDFRAYKSTTILRRLGRRMQVRQVGSLRDYLALLSGSEEELSALHRELLISVTRFFRDEEAFKSLEEKVMHRIVDGIGRHDTARVWIAGCSTGEEAYSLAIMLHEAFEALGRRPQIKIFATDVNQANLQFASAGAFPNSIAAEVSAERLERFFTQERDMLTVAPEIRQSLVFARHDLLRDPPFTRMDLVSCRNTLIYFRREAQANALRRLQYAVRSGGYLFLGTSETLVGYQSGFQPVDAHNKIFTRLTSAEPMVLDVQPATPLVQSRGPAVGPVVQKAAKDASRPANQAVSVRSIPNANVVDAAVQSLLDAWAPPSILVNNKFEAVHFQGDLRPYLIPRSGKASLDLARLMPETMVAVASVLIEEAIKENAPQSSEPVELNLRESAHPLRLHAVPVASSESGQYVLLSFEKLDVGGETASAPRTLDLAAVAQSRIEMLERQLDVTRADLQSTIEELETSNEELQATNEELMASNEELQSSNEELQSVNEEINTVNAEYQEKMALLNRLNGDLSSMIRAVGIATIFLDEALLITRFSPDASAIFKLRDGDVGRPLGDIAHRLKYPNLLSDIRATIRSENRCEREVMAEDGKLYRVRIVPYSIASTGHRGAVVTLMNVTVYRDLARLQGIIDALPEHVAVLDFDGTIVLTNQAWSRFARANGDPKLSRCGPGNNYLEVCRTVAGGPDEALEDEQVARRAYEGIKSILEGARPSFSMEYPCHSPDENRWFYMTAASVMGQEFGAVVSHIEITSWYESRISDNQPAS